MPRRCSNISIRSRQQFGQFQPETFRFVEKHGFDLKCNVKVLLDAFLEVYHLKSIHQSTVDRFLDSPGHDDRALSQRAFTDGHAEPPPRLGGPRHRGHEAGRDRDASSRRKNNPSWNFYPNLVAPIDPDRLPVPALLADGRRHDAHRMPLVRAGLGRRRAAPAVADAHLELRPHPGRGPTVRRTDPAIGASRPAFAA